MKYLQIKNNYPVNMTEDEQFAKDNFGTYIKTDLEDFELGNPKWIYDGEKIIENPNYPKLLEEIEQERIGNLKITKRVFALALRQFGITYAQLKEIIAGDEQAQLEWDLCVELQRNNPLLDIMAAQLGIVPAQIDCIFRKANGENIELS